MITLGKNQAINLGVDYDKVVSRLLIGVTFFITIATALVGPNGAGKSTVLNIITRLIAQDSGVIEFEGKALEKWKSKELAKKLAILTQQNNIAMKWWTWQLSTWSFKNSQSDL